MFDQEITSFNLCVMEKWLRYLALCVFLVDAIVGGVSAQPNNCAEFKVIPPDQYDRQSNSSDDITKRPLGYSFAISYFPGVVTNPENPCVYLNNLTSKSVEVMVQTRVPGESVCVKDNSPQPKTACNTGAFVAGCWEATADTMRYEFYCDPGKGCNSNVQFWYRLTPSTGDDIDEWCLSRSSDDFPNTLAVSPPIPPPVKPTVKNHTAPHLLFSSVVVFNLLFYVFVIYL